MTDSNIHVSNKLSVHQTLKRICEVPLIQLESAVAETYTADASCFAVHPINELFGSDAIRKSLWLPMRQSFPDIERRDLLIASGAYQGKEFVAVMGHYQATFAHNWLDIPATGGVVYLRFGEIHELAGGRIVRSHVLIDLLDLMRQAGCWPISPSVGTEGMWPAPATQTGLLLDSVDEVEGAESWKVVGRMHQALFDFDGRNLESMDLAKFWTEHFMWYGPAGIGATRGLSGFRAHHQIPFLRAFPDRKGGNHITKLGDGSFVVTGGWPSVVATHSGPDWLGLPATGKRVNMRVMDFYRLEGGLIAENWVPIDIIDILRQLGVDVFARLRHRLGDHPASL